MMTETLAKPLQVVTISTPTPCCKCEEEIGASVSAFWRVTKEGVTERWHIECDPEYQRRHELRTESNADFDAREAEDIAEDRHLRSLEGE